MIAHDTAESRRPEINLLPGLDLVAMGMNRGEMPALEGEGMPALEDARGAANLELLSDNSNSDDEGALDAAALDAQASAATQIAARFRGAAARARRRRPALTGAYVATSMRSASFFEINVKSALPFEQMPGFSRVHEKNINDAGSVVDQEGDLLTELSEIRFSMELKTSFTPGWI